MILREKAFATLLLMAPAAIGGFVVGHFQELGSDLEMQFQPHSSPRVIVWQHRYEKVVCWTNRYDKYRPGSLQRWNYHLSDDKGNVEAATPMRVKNISGSLDNPSWLNTGEPPKTSEETPIGNNIRTSFCMDIPSWMKPTSVITVYGEVGYNGPMLFGKPLWMNYIQMPPITFEPEAT